MKKEKSYVEWHYVYNGNKKLTMLKILSGIWLGFLVLIVMLVLTNCSIKGNENKIIYSFPKIELPKIQAKEIMCLSKETYEKFIKRELNYRKRVEKLEAILRIYKLIK